MKHFPTLLTLLAALVLVIAAGCESTPPSAAELDTTPLYSAAKGKPLPAPPGLAPIDSTGFMTVEKDTSGME